MKLTRLHLVAALTTIAIAAPVSTAGAAASAGQPARVVGPTYITTAPATFINNNNQVSTSATSAGSQTAG